MNLPFSPTFFIRIDIFQQLVDFENEKDVKKLWDGVKAVLLWSASIHHQHLGSAIGANHVQNALKLAVSERYLSEEDKKRMYNSAKYILESLPSYGFGEFVVTADTSNPSVRISRNGILAGKILKETNSLKYIWKYQIWTILWWIFLGAAGVILLSQTLAAVKSIFSSGSPTRINNYHQNHHQKYL